MSSFAPTEEFLAASAVIRQISMKATMAGLGLTKAAQPDWAQQEMELETTRLRLLALAGQPLIPPLTGQDVFEQAGEAARNRGFILNALVGNLPKAADAYRQAAEHFRAAGKMDLADKTEQDAQACDDPDASNLEARLSEAVKAADAAARDSMEEAEARITVGECYLALNRAARARPEFERAEAVLSSLGHSSPSSASGNATPTDILGQFLKMAGDALSAPGNATSTDALGQVQSMANTLKLRALFWRLYDGSATAWNLPPAQGGDPAKAGRYRALIVEHRLFTPGSASP